MAKSKNGPLAIGRPTTYRKDVADSILEMYSDGCSLRSACEAHGVARGSFWHWVDDNVDDLAGRYARVVEKNRISCSDDILYIADSAPSKTPEQQFRARLMLDARKFIAAKMHLNQPNKTQNDGIVNDLPDPTSDF